MNYCTKTKCRVCGKAKMRPILDLGRTPLANAFVRPQDRARRDATYPLKLVFCERCSLVQLAHVVDPNVLFKGYHYLTSGSTALVEHFERMAITMAERADLTPKDLVVEIGSNDGIILSKLKDKARVLGIDPAETAAALAAKKGVDTVVDFFNGKVAKSVAAKHGQAKVIIANNVIAHIDDLDSVFEGIRTLLSDDGFFVFEVHWVNNLISDGGFDQIYHEHLSYFSLHSLVDIAKRFGLEVTDVELVPIHGQSMRVFIQKNGKPSQKVRALLARENKLGLLRFQTYRRFAPKVIKNRAVLTKLLTKLKKQGKKIVGYGASAKGNTLLNYMRITAKHLDFITDTTPLKQGMYTPGAHIPVVSPDILEARKPDYVLLLAWNYAPQILQKEAKLRMEGVKFIIPVPQVKVV